MLNKPILRATKRYSVVVRRVRVLCLGNIQICWRKAKVKEPGLIKYQQTITYDSDGERRDTTTKEYDTSITNLCFGLVAVSVLCLTSVAIAKMIFTTPSVVIQQPQQPTRIVGY